MKKNYKKKFDKKKLTEIFFFWQKIIFFDKDFLKTVLDGILTRFLVLKNRVR